MFVCLSIRKRLQLFLFAGIWWIYPPAENTTRGKKFAYIRGGGHSADTPLHTHSPFFAQTDFNLLHQMSLNLISTYLHRWHKLPRCGIYRIAE